MNRPSLSSRTVTIRRLSMEPSRDAADETDAFDVVVFDAVDTFANVPRRAGPFFMDDDWDDDLVAVSQYSYVSSYDNEPYVSFLVRSTAWMDAHETWCLLCQNFFANLTFALMISVFVVAGIFYLLIEDDNEDDDDDHHACRCCKNPRDRHRCGRVGRAESRGRAARCEDVRR